MRHGIVGRKLNRTRAHYHALMNNLATSLLRHESIVTTLPKAKELRPMVEKIITLGKKGMDKEHGDACRRLVFRNIRQKDVLKKLFTDIAPRMADRNGGYTRIVKTGVRASDASPMAIIQLVDYTPKAKAAAPVAADADAKAADAANA